MSISAVGAASAQALNQLSSRAEAGEAPGVPDRDGDADDAAVGNVAAPTVNASGQTIGTLVNTKV